VYRNGEPIPDEEELVAEDGNGTVVETEGNIVGAATGISFETEFWGSRIRCVGIAAVGILPEWRGTGAGAALMRGAHQQYLSAGFDFAALYPFRAEFYRKFGYEYAGYWLKIKAKPDQIRVCGDLLRVREILNSDVSAIRPLYEAFSSQMNGMNYRNELQWQRLIGTDKPCSIYVAGDPVEAYVLVRLNGTFWVSQTIKEVVATTHIGYLSILKFLKGLGNNKSELEWIEPANSRFLAFQSEQGVQISRDAQVMWRALNVGSILSKLPVTNGEGVSLSTRDPEIRSNDGSWLFANSGIEYSAEVRRETDATVSVGQFSQFALGQPSFFDMAEQGAISVKSPSAIKRLSEIFPPRTVCHADWY
jgi:predicted acetyltransferase